MSTNAKPVARVPTTPAAAPEGEAITAEALGWQLRSALPPMRLHSVSLYNNEADVLWLSEGALGPDEHNVVVEAIEYLKAEKGQLYHELGMEDGRIAIFLGIRGPRGDLAGTVMILADMKSLSEGTMERVLTVPVKTLMQKMAVFLRKTYPQQSASTGDTSQLVAIAPSAADAKSVPVPLPASAAATITTKALPPPTESLAPRQVDAMLTLELVDEPAPAVEAPKGKGPAHAPVAPQTSSAAAKVPVIKAVPRKVPPAGAPDRTGAAGAGGKGVGAGPANAPRVQAAAPTSAPAPLPAIDVLPFDPGISIPTARPAAATAAHAADIEVLQFDASIQIPTAHPAPAAAEPSVDIEVLDFDAELTIPPSQLTKAVPVVTPPIVKAATPAVEAPVAKVARGPAVEPPVVRAAPSPSLELPVAKVVSPPVVEPPVATSKAGAATKPSASAATVSVPLLNTGSTTTTARAPKSDEPVVLIQDTGPFKKLEMPDETAAGPALPAAPPPPALTVEETASDLTLFVQELIKLRSSGRTRRYEVLARSQRDAGRNEVPTAFIADSAKGREGSALDSLVLERLLQWLGTHGETIWDSEPASFSVNLSIGALEDASFPEKIGKWLEQYNVPPEHVGFEISEFACVQCRPAVQRFVEACEKLGCFLVIDNFSFDSNMFEFLGSKALRHVKIDPKLTSAAMKEKLPQALVVAILQACKVLGVHCVAKRIESQSSLQWLTAVGCDFAQSFQLEKPTALDTLVSGKSIKALRE